IPDSEHIEVNVDANVLLGGGINGPPPSRSVRSRQRRALVAGTSILLVLLTVVVAEYASLKATPRPDSVATDIFALTLQALLPAPVAIAFWVYAKLTWTPLTLLWLRKFRESDRDKYRFQFLIKGASAGRLNPVTIQDASYRASFLPGALNPLVISLLSLVLTSGAIGTV